MTISGVPAHLVPSPRRLARLQADGQNSEALPEVQTQATSSESQNPALPQSQELTEEGEPPKKDLLPSSHLDPPQEVNSSTLGIPQEAQDIPPKEKEGDGQPADLPPKTTIEMDGSEDEPGPREVEAEGQSSAVGSQEPSQHPGPSPQLSSQSDQDKESGEIKGAPSNPPLSESAQGSDPTSVQDKGTEPTNLVPSTSAHSASEDSPTSGVVKSAGGSQPPPKEGTPKAEVPRAGTPYPEIPPPQDSSTNSKHTQVREQPVALLPRSRLAPTRLPQPQTLAPLQSRRPTPKLLSPSREEALGTSSDQTPAPSPRSLPTQDGDPSKLPPISPPQSKQPPNPSPDTAHSSQQAHVGKGSEMKLPLISPPVQEQAQQQHSPNPPQEEEAPKVRLPHIPAPSVEPQLPQNTGPRSASKPTKERKTPKVGHTSSKKIPDLQASPHSQEAAKQKDARKKNLRQREIAKGSPHPRKMPAGKSQTNQQSESHSKPTPRNVSEPLATTSPLSHAEAAPADPQNQEEKTHKAHNSRKKGLAQSVGASQNPETSEGFAQEDEMALGENQPTREGQPQQPTAESAQEGSAPAVHRGGREQAQKKERSQKREVVGKPPERETAAPSQPRAKETQAPRDTSELRQGYAQRHNLLLSKQQPKEKRTRKNGAVPENRSPAAAPQNQVLEEEQGSRTGRLRARGSQSIKV